MTEKNIEEVKKAKLVVNYKDKVGKPIETREEARKIGEQMAKEVSKKLKLKLPVFQDDKDLREQEAYKLLELEGRELPEYWQDIKHYHALIKPVKLRRLTDEEIQDINAKITIPTRGIPSREIISSRFKASQAIAQAQLDQIKSDNPTITFEEE